MNETIRIRMYLNELKTTLDRFCVEGCIYDAEEIYNKIKVIVKDYPDQPDMQACLANSCLNLIGAHIKSDNFDKALALLKDFERLTTFIEGGEEQARYIKNFIRCLDDRERWQEELWTTQG